MGAAWLLLLLFPSLLRAQVTPDFLSGFTVEVDNSTDSSTNRTVTSSSPDMSSTSTSTSTFTSTSTSSSTSTSTSSSTSTSTSPPETSEFTVMPSQVTTEQDDWSPAETFLYTGDPSTLEVARCSRAYSPAGQIGSLPNSFGAPLRPALDAVANTANFLNMIFQASDLRESTVEEDMEWYHAMVRALLEADVLIQRAMLTFDADPTATAPQLVLHTTRDPKAKVRTIVLQDLSKAWESLHPPAPAPDDSWFRSFKFPDSNQPLSGLSKRVLLNDLSTLDTPKWRQGDSYVTNHSGVRWANAPFLDCRDERFVPNWMLTLSTSFYGLKPDLTPEFRGVIRVDVNIQNIDLDQCTTEEGWFADTHQCNRTTMECLPVPGRGFRLGQYCCRCKEGYYNPEIAPQNSDGGPVNRSDGSSLCYPIMPICLPCWPGCKSCQDGTPCWVQVDWILRSGVLAVQGIFMFLIFVSMLVAYQQRGNRRIRASGVLLLEMILFGSLLLYFPVFILYFKPSTFRCILLRWVRMLGFSIVYGTVTLKMYRVLKVFLSRTAQRVPYMSSFHLLRLLGVMLMTVSWFLCAWTVGVLQNRDRNIPVFVKTNTTDGQGFNLCYEDRWDYMMAVAELLFLCWGSSLWTAVRPVPSAFHEPRYMGIAIHNELLLSSMFHLFRFTFPSLHPDWMLLLSFTHTHVTITVTLALLFIPKLLSVSKSRGEEIAAEVYEDEVDLRRSCLYLNSSFHSAWSEPNVDPEDFRDELKKLYAQLEVNKNKKMTANNPHLPKKRGSRCTLGRSIIRRIAEIPGGMSRRCSREEKEGSFCSRSVNMSDSFRIDTVSISYKSSIKSRSPSIRKSQNDQHYVRERDSSICESMLKAAVGKRPSQRSETNSLDMPPGVCKSASAQNLTIDTNLLHPDHTRLHKSWSLTSNSTHSIENIQKVNRSSTVLTRSNESISISDQTRSALQSESFDKAEVCPWEVEPEQSVEKSQKRVTYANSQDGEEQRPPSPLALICPWEVPPVEKTPSVEKGETESPKPQAPVSASAPASPRPKITKDQRMFSFHTASIKWLSVKSMIGSVDGGSRSSINKEDSVSQKSQESASTTPRPSSRRPSVDRSQESASTTPRPSSRRPSVDRSQESASTTPRPSSRRPSVDRSQESASTTPRPSSRRPSVDRSQESASTTPRPSSRLPGIDKRSLQKRSMTTDAKPSLVKQNAVRLSSVDSTERSPRRLSVARAVSPWDIDDMRKDGTYENVVLSRQNSKRGSITSCETASTSRTPSTHRRGKRITTTRRVSHADICPWEGTLQQGEGPKKQQSIKADICPWDLQESEQTDVCPWESQDVPVIAYTTLRRGSQAQKSLKHRPPGVCPWETAETPQPLISQGNENANVCPWDVQDKTELVYENLNPLDTKESLMVPLQQKVMKPAVYPGGSKESLSNEQHYHAESRAMNLDRQPIKTEESCPWEFPDPPKFENICPWEEGNIDPTNTGSSSQLTIKADICPWESGGAAVQKEGTDARGNICPWETENPEIIVATKMRSQGSERLANVCPWETVGTESGNKEASIASESFVRQDTARTSICPWETGEEEAGTVKTEVSKASEKLRSQGNSREDVCPWDTDATKIVQQPDSTRAGICPWETDEPKVIQKQDSLRADVCPWDTDTPKTVQQQDSTRAGVCPWETDEPNVLQKQDSLRGDICPWDTDAPKTVQQQDSTRAGVCPWETDEPKVFKKQDSTVANVCPWETEEPGVVKKQDSPTADVCPWESVDPQTSSKENVDHPSTDKDDVTENLEPFIVETTPADITTEETDESIANLALGQQDGMWEMARSRSGSFTDNASDVFTWEPENIPEEDEEDDAECAAEALVFPPDL